MSASAPSLPPWPAPGEAFALLDDQDGDGLPRWYEEQNQLSDTHPADAASDA